MFWSSPLALSIQGAAGMGHYILQMGRRASVKAVSWLNGVSRRAPTVVKDVPMPSDEVAKW